MNLSLLHTALWAQDEYPGNGTLCSHIVQSESSLAALRSAKTGPNRQPVSIAPTEGGVAGESEKRASFARPRLIAEDLCSARTVYDEWLDLQDAMRDCLTRESNNNAGTENSDGTSKCCPILTERSSKKVEFAQSAYYKNRLELSVDGGWLPINIPFVFDVFLGDAYTMTDLKYTLVPIIASVRWQMNDVGGPWILRGNWDLTASAGVTLIPRGPETHYLAWIMGIRRNFVPHRGRIAAYFDGRLGMGRIDAKAPLGVLYAQGQNFTFTMNMGSGIRYNFTPRYSFSAGLNWMHISNLYLSQPKFANYGINVYGPMFGIDVRLGKFHRHASE